MLPVPTANSSNTQPGKKRSWWCVAGFVASFFILATLAGIRWMVHNVFPYAIVATTRGERWLIYHGVTPESIGLRADPFSCSVAPKLELKGWFLRAQGTAHGTIFLLHGHNSCKEAMLRLGRLFVEQGFNVLVYDSRGHGESGGTFCTYGYYEHGDCSRCLDEVISKYGDAVGPVAIYGNSFGGAVALQTMANDPRFRCGIIESTFATLPEIVRDYEQHISGVRLDRLTDAALAQAGTLAHFNPAAVRPEEAARQVRCPVLLIHGTADQNISCRYGERIFKNLTAPGSEWFPVPGAGHGNLWQIGGESYRQRILDFVARWDH